MRDELPHVWAGVSLPRCPAPHCGGQLVGEEDVDGSGVVACLFCGRVTAWRPSPFEERTARELARLRAEIAAAPRGRGRPLGSRNRTRCARSSC